MGIFDELVKNTVDVPIEAEKVAERFLHCFFESKIEEMAALIYEPGISRQYATKERFIRQLKRASEQQRKKMVDKYGKNDIKSIKVIESHPYDLGEAYGEDLEAVEVVLETTTKTETLKEEEDIFDILRRTSWPSDIRWPGRPIKQRTPRYVSSIETEEITDTIIVVWDDSEWKVLFQ